MSKPTAKLTFLIDEGAPVQAGIPFARRGHDVLRHSDVLAAGARDEAVVTMAIASGAILVATDRDMQGFARRFGSPSLNEKHEGLDLIFLNCRARLYEIRLEQALGFIELEWAFKAAKQARRMWISIEDHRMTTYR